MLNLLMAVVVSATIDSSTIALGSQTDLHLQVKADTSCQVRFPDYERMLIPDIEIVEQTGVSSSPLPDGVVQYNQVLTLTSFSDSLYLIPGIPFCVGTDTVWSNSLSLNVVMPFDKEAMAKDSVLYIADIKDIQSVSIGWLEILEWSLLGFGAVGLCVGIFFLTRYIIRRKRQSTQTIHVQVRPAEEIALEQLRRLRESKLWQTGKMKQYHIALSDVMREYVASRYGIRSAEKTSDETLREIQPMLQSSPELFSNLRSVLQLADMVKFAKWQATPDENEQALSVAIDFVVKTSPNSI